MAYNISETSGNSTGGASTGYDKWTFNVAFSDATVRGDFNEDVNQDGISDGEASSYQFSALSTNKYGTLSFNTRTGQFTFTINQAAVIASGSSQTVEFTVTGFRGLNSDADRVVINIAICVLRGTRIDTAGGRVAVEDLKVGDQVRTLDSGCQPIRWLGSRRLTRRDLDRAPDLRPIRLAAGALGPRCPDEALVVSPQHRVLVTGWKAELHFGQPEVLVPAKSLVNDLDITIAHDLDDVEYFHVLFDHHEIMVTNGAPTESFFPGDYVMDAFDQPVRDELAALFPALFTDPAGFGPAARSSVKVAEAAVLRPEVH
ncbi:Hint domain-containing protein [Pseudosulfitobacter pseudonitzschiae]|uniref:Hint domain-containing protein n=1 Tax=Pseudosulfitobacter pseudonitzschiae TaxID=1402135 RepID=UPI001AFC18D8|nr:Hint domain-containing protein [Pseudosulfitobacter pseudonitzschiae]MBM1813813.1 Hint domain-containing protein [Pseudosulfitobacter pseudonitzschiae]MBM1830806.1 Hint domain-containing protein [Pseudosulfitobacter pseudonitzschiae]MBM1835673.1 Hint domain-containing protein [Pseudosulfitobacter pseudonitzschiae]MBM1840519.1 Hint domain-containing protein [Pseudosulfitobacter pseudonitzschiae]MBM1845493.1 Hint domain-containing protein [Pseudosulfitobacter pseudonitzschiae]